MRLTLIECLLLVAAAVLATGCGRTSGSSDAAADAARDPRTAELAAEVHDLGWIVFGARTEKGDWDLFVMRPDGSERRNITNTAIPPTITRRRRGSRRTAGSFFTVV